MISHLHDYSMVLKKCIINFMLNTCFDIQDMLTVADINSYICLSMINKSTFTIVRDDAEFLYLSSARIRLNLPFFSLSFNPFSPSKKFQFDFSYRINCISQKDESNCLFTIVMLFIGHKFLWIS